jgi:hypothetical protein
VNNVSFCPLPARQWAFLNAMQTDEQDRMAVQELLGDAERALALAEGEDDHGNLLPDAVAKARENYIDLVRRSRRLTMRGEEQVTFQRALDRLRAFLRFFGETT